MEEIQVCSNEGPRLSQRGDKSEKVKLIVKVKILKIFKVALGVCFALKFVERRFTSFHIFKYLR